jgi:hypothetical protein
MGLVITLAGLGLLLIRYFAMKPTTWFDLGWVGIIIGALIIYIDWR